MKKTLLIITVIHWTGLTNTMNTDPLKAITQPHQQNNNPNKPPMGNKDIAILIQQVIDEQRQKKTNPNNTIISKL